MSDRNVKVRLSAVVSEYEAGMRRAAQATRDVGTEGEKLAQTRQAMQTLGATGMAAGTLLAAGVGVAIAKFAEFDQAMSQVKATGADARENQDALRQAALDAGAATVFSATESANAIEEMAKAGVDAKDILGGGLSGALDLAAAGGLGVADAAGIAATALKIFKLEGSDMSHVADLLAAGAGKAMGDVKDLSMALAQGGQVAASTGLSIEETTAALSAFASQGLLGSDAGTSFKTMLQRLTPQSEEAQKKFDELGISAFDAQGQFVGLAAFAGQLQTALAKLTPEQRSAALAVMFGSDAVRAANVLYDEGAAGIQKWIAAVDDQGYAAETARTRLDNLKGDWEAFNGALDTALITMGEGANGPLRLFVQALTGLVDGFNYLPDWMQQVALGTGALLAAVGVLGGGFLLAVPKIAEFKMALATLGPTAQRAAGAISAVGSVAGGILTGVGLATVATDLLTQAFANVGLSAAEFQNRIQTASDGAKIFGAAIEKQGVKNVSLASEQLRILGDVLDGTAEKTIVAGNTMMNLKRVSGELADIAATNLPEAQHQFRLLAESANLTDAQQQKMLETMTEFREALIKQADGAVDASDKAALLSFALGEGTTATDANASSTKDASDAYREAGDEASGLNDALKDLIDTINAANGVGQDAVSANISYQDALRDVDEQIRKVQQGVDENKDGIADWTASIDASTESGSKNLGMLNDLAEKSQSAADAQFQLDGNTESYRATLEAGRQALIDRAMQLGANEEQARALADQIYRIPSETQWKVIANTADANTALGQFITDQSRRVITIGVTTYRKDSNGDVSFQNQGSGIIGHAYGGPVVGPGGPTDDRVLRRLSNGEHVVTAAEVNAAGGHGAVEAWRNSLLRPASTTSTPATPTLARASSTVVQQAPDAPSAPVAVSLDGARFDLVLEDGTSLSAFVQQKAARVVSVGSSGRAR